MSKELRLLLDAFKKSTGITPIGVREDRTFYHWKRLIFGQLNSEQLLKISEFIVSHFSTRGKYSHLLPTLHSFDGQLALTFDAEEINEFLK
jgi:hypothetical protein